MIRKISASILLLVSVQANAALIDFENLATASYGGIDVSYVEEDGFLISPVGSQNHLSVFQDGWQSNRGASNGTNTLATYGPNTSITFSLHSTDGSAFSIKSIDLTGLVKDSDPDWLHNADSVFFSGRFSDGSSITSSFILDGINDGVGGLVDFETYEFSSDWTNLMSVSFIANNTNGTYTSYLNFDNIVVSSVPEPSIIALMFTGLFGLGIVRRKTRMP